VLYDMFAALGAGPSGLALDVGCRDARYAVEIAQRFGCRVLGVDPVALHVERARALVERAGLSGQVWVERAGIEALPIGDGEADWVWCRDMLVHVDLVAGLAECARALRPGGRMLVYQTFATEAMSEAEAARIYRGIAIVPANMAESAFCAAAEAAGLRVDGRDVIGSEWRERWAEEGSTALRDDLVRLARLRRRGDELVTRFGRERYEAEWAEAHWGVYQMLGKLQPTVYTLTRS
jgi:SAM-dependent methyltransferase